MSWGRSPFSGLASRWGADSEEEERPLDRALRRRHPLVWTAAAAGVLATGLFAWALLWPDPACAQPACARERFSVGIEVDALSQVEPIAFQVPTDSGRVSLHSILRAGGIDVDLEIDQLDLPYRESSGSLDRADLFQFASAWRSSAPRAGADATVYALLTNGLVSDNGDPLFGIMFDNADREGFALAPATTARFFGEHEPDAVETLQLRTFVHELLHALNRHHGDAVITRDGRLTLEAPTRCISRSERGPTDWSLVESPLMAISPPTIRFFQTAAAGHVLPGRQHSSFDLQRASPTECDDARARSAARPLTRWQLARQRLKRVFAIPTADAAAGDPKPGTPPPPGMIELRLQAQPAAYPLGYPIAVRVLARNGSDEPLPLEGRLDPAYGMVSIEYRRADAAAWQDLRPLAFFESIGSENAMVEPGEQTEQTVPVYYDQQGWIFREPGEYELRARLRTDSSDAISTPVVVRVEAPRADIDRAVLQPLLDADARLDDRMGRLLIFGGRIGQPADIGPLEEAAEPNGRTALGAALRLTLASQRLRPPIDPRTGERPLADLGAARALLEDTCADSGIAALREQLLARHEIAPSQDAGTLERSSAMAWDGTGVRRGEPVPTYSDPNLRALGPSLHFCFDEAGLRRRVDRALQHLARELRRARPARIVVVGHADYEGSCRRNDELARRRAQAVRRALIHYGVRGASIGIASLGERRPLDFATIREAHALNRRVEILAETESGGYASEPQRVLPEC